MYATPVETLVVGVQVWELSVSQVLQYVDEEIANLLALAVHADREL